MNRNSEDTPGGCYFLHVHLLVTGKAEEDHLPKLFSRIAATGACRFAVERRIRQLSPRSKSRPLRMVGRGGRIPSRAESEISLPARKLLRANPDRFLVLIDDLEHDRRDQVGSVFELYRDALDKLLSESERSRVAVHFLVNMLEAYFFADPGAVKRVLGQEFALPVGDVEDIRNPKNQLKRDFPNYRERRHGGQILEHLDLHEVLADPQTCAWLRSCVAWIVRTLIEKLDPSRHSVFDEAMTVCHLEDGRVVPLTLEQRRTD